MTSGLQPSDASCKITPIYQLGQIIFSLKNCDARYKEDLAKLLPHYKGEALPVSEVQEIDTGCSKEVLDLIRQVASRHHKQNCVWIEACCLISPSGQKILLTGKSKSGKSTTAMFLALKKNWQILAENFCIIDYAANRLVKFISPASFDDRSIELLIENGAQPKETLSLEFRKNRVWAQLEDVIGTADQQPRFDIAIWLERPEELNAELVVSELTPGEMARKVFAISNLLKIKGSSDSFMKSLTTTRCLSLTGGELLERAEAIASL